VSSADEVEVFRSKVLFEAEMIAGTLEEEGIPNFLRREMANGLQLTMMETTAPPGQSTVIFVPREMAARAREVIAGFQAPGTSLEATGEDAIEPSSPGQPKRGARNFARVLLFLILIPFLIGAIGILVGLIQGF
jgi:hypothetical protein